MNEMTLPFRHRIRNSSLGGLSPSTLPLGQWGFPQYWIFTSERRRNILFLWNLNGVRTRDLRLSKQAALTTAPGPPPRTQSKPPASSCWGLAPLGSITNIFPLSTQTIAASVIFLVWYVYLQIMYTYNIDLQASCSTYFKQVFFQYKSCILPPTNRKVVQPVTWRDWPITTVI